MYPQKVWNMGMGGVPRLLPRPRPWTLRVRATGGGTRMHDRTFSYTFNVNNARKRLNG